MKNIIFTLGIISFGSVAIAQNKSMEVYKISGQVQITKVESSKVCWATISTSSANGIPSFFATYKLKSGDRWQVVGNAGIKSAQANDILTIRFDDEPFIFRELQLVNNTFALPFIEDTDLAGFDQRVAKSQSVEFNLLRLKDKITVDLEMLRQAKNTIDQCLETIK